MKCELHELEFKSTFTFECKVCDFKVYITYKDGSEPRTVQVKPNAKLNVILEHNKV